MKRILFWIAFIVILGLIVWGMIASMSAPVGPKVDDPAPITSADHIFLTSTSSDQTRTVTLLEYSDFQCPACHAYYPIIEQVLASSSVPIRFVYRHYPLPQHPNAPLAAQASEAAAMQGKFWQMHKMLFENHDQWADVGDPHGTFEGYAQRIGLNVDKFNKDIDSDIVKSLVEKSRSEAQAIKLFQTPSFFVNGKLIENPQGYEKFKAAIEAAAR